MQRVKRVIKNGFHVISTSEEKRTTLKTKQIHIRIDEEFEQKLKFLMRINGFRSLSDTIRKLIEKEYRKETEQ